MLERKLASEGDLTLPATALRRGETMDAPGDISTELKRVTDAYRGLVQAIPAVHHQRDVIERAFGGPTFADALGGYADFPRSAQRLVDLVGGAGAGVGRLTSIAQRASDGAYNLNMPGSKQALMDYYTEADLQQLEMASEMLPISQDGRVAKLSRLRERLRAISP